jgi:prepilin-type N-terminal cleavage/methylation domain-containing protein
MNKVKQSFTLVEILVVIVIIGILSSFIFFTINDSVEKASITKSKMFSESIRNNLLLNLVSEWKFDEVNEGITPDSWGSNNGTMGSTTFISDESQCISGGCASFDGVSNSVSHASVAFTASEPWTNTHWVNWQGYGVSTSYVFYMGVAATSNGLILRQTSNNRFSLRNSSSIYYSFGENSSSPYFQTGWFHLAWIADGAGNLSLYVNAQLLDIIPAVTSMNFARIGTGYSSSGGYLLKGLMDEVRVYDAAISESQIKQNYIAGLNHLLASGNISEKEYNENINKISEK